MLKVGQLARRTGLTVRTLHHWDEIGLLRPSHRTASGHRLYDDGDVVRLQRIVSLRQLDLPLDQIAACLARPEYSLVRIMGLHLERLRAQAERTRSLCARLEAMLQRMESAEAVSVDEMLTTIEAMTMYEKYYTKEQLDFLARRREEVGEARIAEVQEEWPRLIAEVRAARDAGRPAADPEVRALARRWKALIDEFTGGDAGILASLKAMYRDEPAARTRSNADDDLRAYVDEAMRAEGIES